ncbi:hypothetical protein Tfer_2853 [Thermincola ferriacetica]|uniref:Uncharacterized protein n=1 Tax=Thermincola ferriacetica TaxID=281456 RepID=A0A0L6VZG7_9FIRM|nr:hypothetical protein Tfer_2853 [Thermincola ferriacetica]
MRERFILVFIFHLFSLSLVLLPKNIKGPALFVFSSVPIRFLDLVAFLLIVGGSIYLYSMLFKYLLKQQQKTHKREKVDQDIKS